MSPYSKRNGPPCLLKSLFTGEYFFHVEIKQLFLVGGHPPFSQCKQCPMQYIPGGYLFTKTLPRDHSEVAIKISLNFFFSYKNILEKKMP